MSTFSLNPDYGIFDFTRNHGVSKDARKIEKSLADVKTEIKRENISIGKSFLDIQRELESILREANVNNWDGYGAIAANSRSFFEAQRFINNYPISMPLPEVSIDPDGEFSFEWYRNNEYSFSISFGENEELTYAGLFGINKIHGTEYFGDEIPEIILDNIKRVYS